jgi:hypothetical protein
VLTDLQQRIALAVSEVVESEGFALAGGAALISQGLVDRRTRDLDFFAVDATSVNRVAPEVESALRSKGMSVIRRVDAPGFIRLEVSEGSETCEVDFGSDARLRPVIETPLGRMIASRRQDPGTFRTGGGTGLCRRVRSVSDFWSGSAPGPRS